MCKVVALIPAHNEEDKIRTAMMSVLNQTHPVSKLVIALDNCTDNTKEIVKELQSKYKGVITYIETINNQFKKAGAMNQALDMISEKTFDYLLQMDADSYIDKDLIKQGVEYFKKNPDAGAVCSTAHIQPGKGFLYRLQKIEYGGFDADRTSTWNNITIIHGMCGMYRVKIIKEIGGYSLDHLLEDYDLTVRIKMAGWKTYFNPKMKAWTKAPLTFKDYFKQRLRWFRGGIEIILDHGFNKYTMEDAIQHVVFILFFFIILLFVSLSAFQGWVFKLNPHPLIIMTILAGYVLGAMRLKYVKKRDVVDVLIRMSLLPELIIATILMWIRVYSYFLVFIRVPKKW